MFTFGAIGAREALLATRVSYYGRRVDSAVLWETARGRWALALAWLGNFFAKRAERHTVVVYATRYGLDAAVPELLKKYDNEGKRSTLAAFGIASASYTAARQNTVAEASRASAEALSRLSNGPSKSSYTSSRHEIRVNEVEDQELITG